MEANVALVTGASSGIGEAVARRLARDGRHLVLVARRVERLEVLGRELEAKHGVRAHVIPADLVKPGSCAALLDDVGRRRLTVDWLVNNAGFGTLGRFDGLPIERELEEIRLNVEALVELTGRCVPGMVARKRGAVINVASVAAFTPSPFMATYSATKAFVLSFTEALAVELEGTGVHVLCVCPGFTTTEFQATAHVDTGRVPKLAWMTAEQVAEQTVDAVGRRSVLVNGAMNSALTTTLRFVPRAAVTRITGMLMRPRAAS